jgi:hypothetical protein
MVEQSREQSNHVQDAFYIFDKNCTSVIYKNRANGGIYSFSRKKKKRISKNELKKNKKQQTFSRRRTDYFCSTNKSTTSNLRNRLSRNAWI